MAALPPPAGDSALVPEPSPVALPPPPAPTTSTGGSGRGRNKDGKEKESFACTFPGCGQSYSRMEYLKRHQRKHQDDRPFQCKDCSKAFARSDVLLRHRRRCHPTPPPVDRDTSPPPSNRIYNNMPVSSSRTDAREQSPPRARGRKHARQSDAVDDQHDRSRPRIDPALQHEHEPEYAAEHGANGEHDGRYDEERGYDGNVYGQYYGQTNQDDHPNYSSHLMPMFAQNQAYHSLNDPNHLEDASVLLSMAYPSGVPGGEGQQEQEQRDLPDWASNPTINLIMETAVASANGEQDALPKATNGDGQEAADASAEKENGTTQAEPTAAQVISNLAEAAAAAPQPISSGAPNGDTAAESTEGGIVSEVIDPTLQDGTPGSEGFLNAMSWLSGLDNQGVLNSNKSSTLGTSTSTSAAATSGEGSLGSSSTTQESRGQEVATLKTGFMPEETSFPMTSLFSPSALNASLGGSSNDGSSEQASTPHILHILEQLAKYEVPQTIANPNPERPLLRLDHAAMALQAGEAFDKDSRFYLPAERFAGCYQIPHWALPPLKTLSVMACRTFHTVLNHFSFVHLPTFKLVDTAACLAFAICTVGGIKTGNASISDRFLWPAPEGNGRPSSAGAAALDGPVVPDQSWESLYEDNWYRCAEPRAAEVRNVANWANGPVVRSEKTNMLVKSFSLAKGVLMTEYNVALLQALILYHAPNFLSENDRERVPANMFLGTIVNITRQIGFFTTENDHFTPSISLPSEPFTPHELDRAWHDWIQLETRRRTAFLVYQLDTISSLESNIPCILSGCEVAYLPLPAPDTLWKAPNAQSWLKGVKKYKPMTLDEAMRRTFYLPTYGAFDALHEKADTQFYNLLNQSDYGPFARMAMVITLLRGIIDIGEGKRDRGDWRDLTDLWVGCSWLRPGKQIIAQDGTDLGIITRESLKERFRLGLQKWREGWDFDSLCSSPTRAATGHYTRSGAPGAGSAGAGVSPESDSASPREDEQSIPKETLNYCEDALPLYWLASGLLGAIISNTTHQPGQNMFSGFNYGDMLKSARTFTRTGEGVPVKLRNMSASQARNERHPSAGPPRNPNMPTPTSAPSSASASSGPPSNPPASSLDPSTHSSSHSTIPTSVSPPDQAGNDNIINQELSSLAEGMSDGTFAGIMQALAAGSGDLSMQLGLINEQGEGEGEGVREGAGAGAEGGNEGNGGGEESLQGLSDQDIAKQLGFMI